MPLEGSTRVDRLDSRAYRYDRYDEDSTGSEPEQLCLDVRDRIGRRQGQEQDCLRDVYSDNSTRDRGIQRTAAENKRATFFKKVAVVAIAVLGGFILFGSTPHLMSMGHFSLVGKCALLGSEAFALGSIVKHGWSKAKDKNVSIKPYLGCFILLGLIYSVPYIVPFLKSDAAILGIATGALGCLGFGAKKIYKSVTKCLGWSDEDEDRMPGRLPRRPRGERIRRKSGEDFGSDEDRRPGGTPRRRRRRIDETALRTASDYSSEDLPAPEAHTATDASSEAHTATDASGVGAL